MFPPEIQVIFDARTALQAAEAKDPKFDQLVQALIERTGLSKEQLVENIIRLANGDISV